MTISAKSPFRVRRIQASGDLFTGKIGKLGDYVFGSFACSQIAQDETHGNSRSLQARLTAEDFRLAHNVAFPFHWHEPILARSLGKGKK